jgi:hypothetical protein
MARRSMGILVAVVVTAACIAPATAAFGVAAAKKSPDPCALITSEAAGAFADPYTIDETDPNQGLKGNCNYYLTSSTKTGEPLNLFVEPLSSYKLDKALTKKTKATKGVGVGGFTGVDGAGTPVLVFKTKNSLIRITGDFDTATLIALAKGINTQLK